MRIDPARATIATLRLGRRCAVLKNELPPADRARCADPEPYSRLTARHPAINRGDHPLPKIL